MKLKKRIKRALAAFLKDELLEFIGYERQLYPAFASRDFKVDHIDFDTIVAEHVIDMRDVTNEVAYEEALDHLKKQMLKEAEKCIHVDAVTLTSPEYMYARSIKLTLRIQKPRL